MNEDFLWRHLRELPYFRALLRAVEARLFQGVQLPPPTLDVGCGDGHFASVAFQRPNDVGIDPDVRGLREARARHACDLLVLADGAHLPHRDGAFASAVSNSVLEHIEGLDAVLNEIARVLRRGSPLVFTVPNPGYRDELSISATLHRLRLRRLSASYQRWFLAVTRTWNLFDEAEWARRLTDAGFALETSRPYFSPSALHALEWGHYLGTPCLLSRLLTRRWILAPWRWNLWLTERALRRHYEESPPPDGTYTFFVARRL
jgi:SAM-dependent methyltransferase